MITIAWIQRAAPSRHIVSVTRYRSAPKRDDGVQRSSVASRLTNRFEYRQQPSQARAVTVNLADNHNRFQAMSKRLFGHEARLRITSNASTTSSTESTMDMTRLLLTTEVSVKPGSNNINDVDTGNHSI